MNYLKHVNPYVGNRLVTPGGWKWEGIGSNCLMQIGFLAVGYKNVFEIEVVTQHSECNEELFVLE